MNPIHHDKTIYREPVRKCPLNAGSVAVNPAYTVAVKKPRRSNDPSVTVKSK
ncbi:MAG TPA: hypothetical protein VK820_08695 [Steroidobacteraceae bacterium]|nr:hypothetical protein [Steroidobacteraceae bacterium]